MPKALATAVSRNLALSPEGGLQAYLSAVRQIPILSPEEERALARRFREDDDLDAARELVVSHLRFVVHIARGYRGYGLAFGDLIQEGNIGLMKAVKRFDPDVGVRLISFAVHWIRAEIHEFILRNWRIVKVATTKAQRKLFFNLRQAKHRLGWLNAEEVKAVAADLGVPPREVVEMESRLAGQDVAFDAQPESDGEEMTFAPAGYLEAPVEDDPAVAIEAVDWASDGHRRLDAALAELDPRSRDILQRRWLAEQKTTLQELADEYEVSAERVRQIENNAIKKLRAAMTA
jgi:RNA polymerase sigma-32 factor